MANKLDSLTQTDTASIRSISYCPSSCTIAGRLPVLRLSLNIHIDTCMEICTLRFAEFVQCRKYVHMKYISLVGDRALEEILMKFIMMHPLCHPCCTHCPALHLEQCTTSSLLVSIACAVNPWLAIVSSCFVSAMVTSPLDAEQTLCAQNSILDTDAKVPLCNNHTEQADTLPSFSPPSLQPRLSFEDGSSATLSVQLFKRRASQLAARNAGKLQQLLREVRLRCLEIGCALPYLPQIWQQALI